MAFSAKTVRERPFRLVERISAMQIKADIIITKVIMYSLI